MSALRGKTIVLCVTGSVAAYKAAALARLLVQAGATVLPVMSAAARHFLGPVTLAAITGHPVPDGMWDAQYPGEMHVDLARRADLIIVAPATADCLARFAHGRASDLLGALALCAQCKLLVAPAMHPTMWAHPATQANVATLEGQGRVVLVGPVDGPVASGDTGFGRMAEPDAIALAAERLLHLAGLADLSDLTGRHVVVTAGPTHEDVDPVRFLGNRSSGKMGFAIATRAAERGARVTLIAGPVALATPPHVDRRDVRSALEMRDALATALGADLSGADALVMAAAVADYRPASVSASKLKKDAGELQSLALTQNPDLLAEVGARRDQRALPVLVGFALETGTRDEVLGYGRKKLAEKRVDVVIANQASASLGRDDNVAVIVRPDDHTWLEQMPKAVLADRILDCVRDQLASRTRG